jgi:gluconate 2-dehydrogenase subunit 3-like protein
MTPDELSRRRFLGTLAAGSAAAWLNALHAPPAHAAVAMPNLMAPPEYFRGERLVTFTAAEAADLDAFAAQIVPSAPDGLGAREAGSIFFIDRALADVTREQRPLFDTGLAELRAAAARHGARSFAALPSAAQTEVLTAMDKAKSEFFAAARAAVVVGLLADPKYGGNRNKVGWKLIGFEDRFHWTAPFGEYDRESTRAQ